MLLIHDTHVQDHVNTLHTLHLHSMITYGNFDSFANFNFFANFTFLKSTFVFCVLDFLHVALPRLLIVYLSKNFAVLCAHHNRLLNLRILDITTDQDGSFRKAEGVRIVGMK